MRDLKVGDQIVIDNGSHSEYSRRYFFATIMKMTATQLTMSDGKRYSRRTGDQIGYPGMYKPRIATQGGYDERPYDYMTIEEAERRNAASDARLLAERKRNAIRNITWRNVPDDALDCVHKLLVELRILSEISSEH